MASLPLNEDGASAPGRVEASSVAAVTASSRHFAWLVLALALGALAVLQVTLAVALWSATGQSFAYLLAGHEVHSAVVAVSFGVIGAVAIYLRPENRLGWLLQMIGQLEALAVLSDAYATAVPPLAGAEIAHWLSEWIWIPGLAVLLGLLTPLFPDGRPVSPRWSLLAKTGLAFSVFATLATLFVPEIVPSTPVPAPPAWQAPLGATALVCLGGLALVGTCGAIGLAVRAARTTGPERRRILWFFTGFVALLLTTALPFGPYAQLFATAFFPVALGIAMLRYGLFDADRLLSRMLLYITLSLLVAAVFAAFIALSATWVGGSGLGAVVAAVAVTIGLAPVRDLVQRAVDRLLYGQRRDPYAAMTGLARKLATAVEPTDMLSVIVETVTQALRLPYAAVIVGEDPLPAAVAGRPTRRIEDVPLWHAGERTGVLRVGLSESAPALDPTDERLLVDVAQQAGAVAHTVRLARDVQMAYDRLAAAQDEERHRIRRDMHDQLGPLLAGVVLGLGAARRAANPGPPEQVQLLGRLQSQVQAGLDDVKRLIADLRPTALDELGLVAALERHASVLSTTDAGGARVQVDAPSPLPSMPSQVEVAAYRICLEALSNAVRHGHARCVHICLQLRGGELDLRVEDDGVGLPDHIRTGGLGLASMTARARDVGGSCTMERRAAGGTVLQACLPLPSALGDQAGRVAKHQSGPRDAPHE